MCSRYKSELKKKKKLTLSEVLDASISDDCEQYARTKNIKEDIDLIKRDISTLKEELEMQSVRLEKVETNTSLLPEIVKSISIISRKLDDDKIEGKAFMFDTLLGSWKFWGFFLLFIGTVALAGQRVLDLIFKVGVQ